MHNFHIYNNDISNRQQPFVAISVCTSDHPYIGLYIIHNTEFHSSNKNSANFECMETEGENERKRAAKMKMAGNQCNMLDGGFIVKSQNTH